MNEPLLPDALANARHAHWLRLGMHIRLALQPSEPRLLCSYVHSGEDLAETHGHDAWQVNERMLNVLLATACDTVLPIVWRLACLDTCTRPLGRLGPLVSTPHRAQRLRCLAHRVASFSYNRTPAA